MPDIVAWAQSSEGFYVDRAWIDGAWVLGPTPIRLAPYHQDLLRHIFPEDSLPYDVVCICDPAKSGKSAIAGLCAVYVALHGDRNSSIVMASNRQQQAQSIMFKSAADAVTMNLHLPNVDPGRTEIRFRNGNVIEAIPSSSRMAAGSRFSLATFDELAGYVHTDAERLWAEFKTDPTRTMSLKLAVGYAGYSESELWHELLQRGLAGQPVPELAHLVNDDGSPCAWRNGRHFVFWSHACRQPWQTEAWREGLRASLRASQYTRMVQTRFVSGTESFIDMALWDACVDSDLRPVVADQNLKVVCGLDAATKGDSAAVVTVAFDMEAKRTVLIDCKVWQPSHREPLDMDGTLGEHVRELATRFRLMGCYFDPWQMAALSQQLTKDGIKMVEFPQSSGNLTRMGDHLLDLIRGQNLRMYPNARLRTAASQATAVESSRGWRISKQKSRHKIDALVALAMAAVGALDLLAKKRKFLIGFA